MFGNRDSIEKIYIYYNVTKNLKNHNLPINLLYNSASLEKFQKVADSMDRAGSFLREFIILVLEE